MPKRLRRFFLPAVTFTTLATACYTEPAAVNIGRATPPLYAFDFTIEKRTPNEQIAFLHQYGYAGIATAPLDAAHERADLKRRCYTVS